MTNIFNLYKDHINPNVDGLEFHEFANKFQIHKLVIFDPDPNANESMLRTEALKRESAIKWILDNSKL